MKKCTQHTTRWLCGRVIEMLFIGLHSAKLPLKTSTWKQWVSVAHGTTGSATHIWIFGIEHPFLLPLWQQCYAHYSFMSPHTSGREVYYFRARSTTYDHLWTGSGCTLDDACCSPLETQVRIYPSVCLERSSAQCFKERGWLCTQYKLSE